MNNEVSMKIGRWHDGSELPKKTGWYLRDYRNPPKQTEGTIPPFSLDYFIRDEHGSFWYVAGIEAKAFELNDAWFESLPWCKLKSKS